MNISANRHGRNIKQRGAGFSLVEMAVVLMIIATLAALFVPMTATIMNNKKRELTRQKLINIETAIANYVAVNMRLPCPSDGSSSAGGER